ncbi:ATPase family protein associated with various cellular activities (AAA) [Laceyella sediminis]|uniref:ATPase family associated with various cellular activities (AAA) n=2 Tax=Laceyella TaxID=292635 RepID=A0AA45WST1_9BACL|nr:MULTISPECIES: MoxR family ATPase [Laceyella]PRZ11941.1 ATPase family protein associated with various cellular activities (AAA) [Laceyella sediminis]SMP34783.1 ATPase family associated with various cellular activities (AAA) [Laceyella tengchongensis]
MTTEETSGFVWDEGHSQVNQLIENIEKVMVGKREVIGLSMAAPLAKGHVLLEDVPGVGKTMLVKALARSLGCWFRRIQFTPDQTDREIASFIRWYEQRRYGANEEGKAMVLRWRTLWKIMGGRMRS